MVLKCIFFLYIYKYKQRYIDIDALPKCIKIIKNDIQFSSVWNVKILRMSKKCKLNDKLSVLCCKTVYPHKRIVSVKNGYK